jgi:hypothetical protein
MAWRPETRNMCFPEDLRPLGGLGCGGRGPGGLGGAGVEIILVRRG